MFSGDELFIIAFILDEEEEEQEEKREPNRGIVKKRGEQKENLHIMN